MVRIFLPPRPSVGLGEFLMILPGSTFGILGGGQLGRMLAQAAQTLGYRVHVFEPQAGCPAGAVADREFNAAYTDQAALAEFARSCDVVTYEFENIPVEPLQEIAKLTRLHPSWKVLEICQNRLREKTWLRDNAFPHAAFREVEVGGDLAGAVREIGLPCVVKTADFGYDGKGQLKLTQTAEIEVAAAQFAGQRAVVERYIDFQCEVSAVVARQENGEMSVFPVAENIHTDHILDFSIMPARVASGVRVEAKKLGQAIAAKIGVVGIIAVEFFVTADNELLINELAPRTHNSGHSTLDACRVSQFEQQVRAVCGLPLGEPELISPVVMVNILGDSWFGPEAVGRGSPAWKQILSHPTAKLHLYGKREPRAGRKMGHFTVMASDVELALEEARTLKQLL